MRRLLYAVPVLALLLLTAGTASADWLRIKVNVEPTIPNAGGNQGGMSGAPGAPGGMMGGMTGGPGGMPGMPGQQQDAEPKDEGPWLYVYIEVKDLKDNGSSTYVSHKWGKQGLLMDMKDFISKEFIPGKAFTQEFNEKFKKARNANAKAKKDVAETLWWLATNAACSLPLDC